jgi:hypothetical protein
MAERLPPLSNVYLKLSLPWLMVSALVDEIMLSVDMVHPTDARLTCQEPPQLAPGR